MSNPQSTHFFEDIVQLPDRRKPRLRGRGMMIDWGMGHHAQTDVLTNGANFIDLAKIAVGVGRLLPRDLLTRKIKLYQEHGIEPFPGGQFLEYAHVKQVQEAYFPAVAEAGYRWCEVSDNLAAVTPQWKQKMIRTAIKDFGFEVLGEVGKKEGLARDASLVDDAMGCVDAGASIILLEAAELVSDDPALVAEVEATVKAVGLDKIMFELPGPWIDGVHACDIHRMRRDLISRFGADVNLGNIDAADVLSLEAFRCQLGVNAGGNEEKD